MSIGSWDPAADAEAHHIHIEQATLERFIALSREDQLDSLPQLIAGAESQALSGLMRLASADWLAAAEPMSEEDIIHLIRFFAVAEQQLPGWETGDQSPVIPLAKTLRGRGQRLDKSLLTWLRSVSDNRFLPYGPL